MKALLISPNTERINMLTLPFGLGCVAAAARQAGHEVRFLDFIGEQDALKAVREAIESFQPGLIGISVRNVDDQNFADPKLLVEKVRELIPFCRSLSDSPIVLGGAGYSIFPVEMLDYLGADMGIQGEGEGAFPALLRHIEQGRPIRQRRDIPGLYIRGQVSKGKRVFERDLDSFSFPDTSLWHHSYADAGDLYIPFQSRRGCAMGCIYCNVKSVEGEVLRRRSTEKVVEGLTRYSQAGFRRFFFVDNAFNMPLSYAKALCRSIRERGLQISWRCIIYPLRVDEELVISMAEAGCTEISIGFESGVRSILQTFNKRFSPEEVSSISALFQKYGIRRTGFLLLGGPGETRESAEESLSFADSLGLDALRVTTGIRIYPDTLLAGIAIEKGLLSESDNLFFPKFYMEPGLGDWLHETVSRLKEKRPHWM